MAEFYHMMRREKVCQPAEESPSLLHLLSFLPLLFPCQVALLTRNDHVNGGGARGQTYGLYGLVVNLHDDDL